MASASANCHEFSYRNALKSCALLWKLSCRTFPFRCWTYTLDDQGVRGLLPLVAFGRELGLDVCGHHANILNGCLEFSGRAAPVGAPTLEFVGRVYVDPVEV